MSEDELQGMSKLDLAVYCLGEANYSISMAAAFLKDKQPVVYESLCTLRTQILPIYTAAKDLSTELEQKNVRR